MKNKLFNLKLLKKDMEQKNWIIDTFRFKYNKDFIVLVKLFDGFNIKKIDKYALVQLVFINSSNSNDYLTLEANSRSIIIDDMKEFRKFFDIKWSSKANLHQLIENFSNSLGKNIPNKLDENKSSKEKRLLCYYLDKADTEDPDKIYCFGIKRNSKGKRSSFNDNKTRILRNELYFKFAADKTLSFLYSKNKGLSDEEIINNFSKN